VTAVEIDMPVEKQEFVTGQAAELLGFEPLVRKCPPVRYNQRRHTEAAGVRGYCIEVTMHQRLSAG
jgi:hypothetical protein